MTNIFIWLFFSILKIINIKNISHILDNNLKFNKYIYGMTIYDITYNNLKYIRYISTLDLKLKELYSDNIYILYHIINLIFYTK